MFPIRLLSQAEFDSACLFRVRRSTAALTYAHHHFVEGLSVVAIAEHYGKSRQSVLKSIRTFEAAIARMEAAVRGAAHTTQGKDRRLTQEDFERACLYRSGKSLTTKFYAKLHFVDGLPIAAIAEHYQKSKPNIWKSLRRFEEAIERMDAAQINIEKLE